MLFFLDILLSGYFYCPSFEEKMKPSGNRKNRKPAFAAFLSLLSTGIGQVYNGQFFRGLMLKLGLLLTLCLLAILVFKSSQELLLWGAVIAIFLLLKLYSTVQAFIEARRCGTGYKLKIYNKSYVYIFVTVIFLAMNLALPLLIAKFALREITPYHPFRSEGAKQRYLSFYDSSAEQWPVESETRMVDTSYGQTYVRISGPVEAPPLVLMHGANATSLSWIPNIQALSENYRTYAVDNIYELGRSVFTKILRAPDELIDWMDEVLLELGLGSGINMVGMSYGGWLTSQYALKHPEKLENIVLLAPAATVLPLGPGFLKPALISLLPHRHFAKKGMETIMADLRKKDERGRKYFESLVDHMDLGLRSFKPKMMVSPTVLTDTEWRSFKMPVLFLIGENEKIYSAQEAVGRLNEVAPSIQAEIIRGAGHDLPAVQAELVNRKILDFFEKR
jgi:pimeloyl-ACP methyl ester carboxylesterase/TM2 domain-containing membrane protein YozV